MSQYGSDYSLCPEHRSDRNHTGLINYTDTVADSTGGGWSGLQRGTTAQLYFIQITAVQIPEARGRGNTAVPNRENIYYLTIYYI